MDFYNSDCKSLSAPLVWLQADGPSRLEAAVASLALQTRERLLSDASLDLPERSQPAAWPTRPDGYHDLYLGLPGIALFLAAYDHVLGDSRCRSTALKAIAGLRRAARRSVQQAQDEKYLRSLGIGAIVGIGALIYGFLRIGQLLGEPELISEAHDLTSLITPASIGNDHYLDIVLGSAGTILALLALNRVTPGPNRNGHTPLDLAGFCGDHLIRQRVSEDGGPRAWRTFPGLPLRSGMSHGAAGISLSLALLAKELGKPELWQAAWEGLSFEGTLYSSSHRSWRTSSQEGAAPLANWCFGAPGIALARLGMLDAVSREEDRTRLREEIRIALATTRSAPPSESDHLCCGNMGRVDILLAAGAKLKDDALTEAAYSLTTVTLSSAEARGGFTVEPGSRFDLSLFRGISGVGYAMLRLCKPDLLPCLLALE